MAEPAIRVEHLHKAYGARVAIEDVSFSVAPGEVFALLGPNGAGKTTTIEILEGYRQPDGGTVSVLGCDPVLNAGQLRRRVGLMLQDGGIYPQARPREVLRLFASFYDDPDDPDRLIDLIDLRHALGTTYRRLSGGEKQRLSLALALIGRPELVFLDEPTAGMDPRARRATWDVIRSLQGRGVTVVLTTHYMDEAEQLADRIGIMDRGRLVALGDVASLRQASAHLVHLTVHGSVSTDELTSLPGVRTVRADGDAFVVDTVDAPTFLADVTRWALERRVVIRALHVGHESLDDIFLRLTGLDDGATSSEPPIGARAPAEPVTVEAD